MDVRVQEFSVCSTVTIGGRCHRKRYFGQYKRHLLIPLAALPLLRGVAI